MSLRRWSCLAALVAVLAPATARAVAPPRLAVTSAALIDQATGRQLYGLSPQSTRAIASTTKIMTALIVLEHVKHLGEQFTQNDYRAAPADSQIGLLPGERMSVHDLLEALLLPSADDAAEDLAYNVGGHSVGRFVGMMNARARELGLTHTHYSTPIGLDTAGNYSSASDLVRLASYVLQHEPFFARVVRQRSATLETGSHPRYIVNRNTLVGRIPWVTGVKTGHTLDAGYVLVASGRRNGMTLIGAVLGTSNEAARDANALALLDYGYAEYRIARLVVAGRVLARRAVRDSDTRAAVIAGASLSRLVKRSDRITLRVQVPRQLAGPMPRHAIVGQVRVLVNGRQVGRVPLLLARRLPAISPLTQAARFLTKSSTLISLSLLVLAALLLLLMRRLLRRGGEGRATGDTLEAG
jgi:D-alanyl-D-alanine carboxypeptidase (penicillin-binding protein 5/6)